jgi:hypothetical protein
MGCVRVSHIILVHHVISCSLRRFKKCFCCGFPPRDSHDWRQMRTIYLQLLLLKLSKRTKSCTCSFNPFVHSCFILSILVHSCFILPILVHSCTSFSSILVRSRPFWSILVHSGPFWSILVHSGPFWSILVQSSP